MSETNFFIWLHLVCNVTFSMSCSSVYDYMQWIFHLLFIKNMLHFPKKISKMGGLDTLLKSIYIILGKFSVKNSSCIALHNI